MRLRWKLFKVIMINQNLAPQKVPSIPTYIQRKNIIISSLPNPFAVSNFKTSYPLQETFTLKPLTYNFREICGNWRTHIVRPINEIA